MQNWPAGVFGGLGLGWGGWWGGDGGWVGDGGGWRYRGLFGLPGGRIDGRGGVGLALLLIPL